jgi:predicted PhzF superfamily epimerase YddE/YHI9
MTLAITGVDAFTDRPFHGNPAAVCVLGHDPDRHWMQLVAREMALSETAFLVRRDEAWALRWFTPAVEVDLCGHATLASAHVLWERGLADPAAPLRFRTRSGELTAERRDGMIWLDFPALPCEWADAPPGLRDALGGAHVKAVLQSRFDLLVELEDEAVVRALAPEMELLRRLPARGIIVTAPASTPGFDFVSRFFGPQVGVPEDPVTGSAHCALAPFWGDRLGKDAMRAYQASARGGEVRVELRGERVGLGGEAVTVWRGEMVGEDDARGMKREG